MVIPKSIFVILTNFANILKSNAYKRKLYLPTYFKFQYFLMDVRTIIYARFHIQCSSFYLLTNKNLMNRK